MPHCLTDSSSDDEAAPRSDPSRDGASAGGNKYRSRRRPRTTRARSRKTAPEPYPSSTAAPTPRALTPATTTTTTTAPGRRATPRRGEYSFSAQPAATPSLSLKTMKQTIKDAGLPTADLFERKDVEERYAQAKARLAEAERLKRRSRDADGAPAPKAPRASNAAAAAATEPAARATTGAAATRREHQCGARACASSTTPAAWRV